MLNFWFWFISKKKKKLVSLFLMSVTATTVCISLCDVLQIEHVIYPEEKGDACLLHVCSILIFGLTSV